MSILKAPGQVVGMYYAPNISIREVPDPYYGGPNGFDNVLDLIEAASDGLITAIQLPLRDRQLK